MAVSNLPACKAKFKFDKSRCIRRRQEYQQIARCSMRQVGHRLIIDFCENGGQSLRFGITVTRKFGKAHERNRFKRLVREAIRLNYSKLKPGFNLNIKPRPAAKNASLQEIERELIQLFS